MKESHYIIESMLWYFRKANRGLHEILNMNIPADGDNLRFYYGVYIEAIFSAIDLMRERNYTSHKKIDDLLKPKLYKYFRELRNSIVHRGYDLAREGTVLNDQVYLRTPTDVHDKYGNFVSPPEEALLIHFLLIVDGKIRDFIFDNTIKFLSDELTKDEKNENLENLKETILNYPHMEDIHKKLFFDNIQTIKDAINNDQKSDQTKILNYEKVIKFNGFFK